MSSEGILLGEEYVGSIRKVRMFCSLQICFLPHAQYKYILQNFWKRYCQIDLFHQALLFSAKNVANIVQTIAIFFPSFLFLCSSIFSFLVLRWCGFGLIGHKNLPFGPNKHWQIPGWLSVFTLIAGDEGCRHEKSFLPIPATCPPGPFVENWDLLKSPGNVSPSD